MLLHEEQSGRFFRRPKQGYPAATVAEFCTAVPSADPGGAEQGRRPRRDRAVRL